MEVRDGPVDDLDAAVADHVGTLASGSTVRMTGSASTMTSTGVR